MMRLPWRPILSALLRNRLPLTLIGLQIALTLAMICNVLFIVSERFALMQRASGMDEANTFTITTTAFGEHASITSIIAEDLRTLRSLPGVQSAAPIVSVPLDDDVSWTEDVYLGSDQQSPTSDDVAVYFTDDQGLATYGADLIAGRNFTAEEVGTRDADNDANKWPSSVIVTKALANHLFPNDEPIGKQFNFDKSEPSTIVGVIDRLQAPDPHHTNVSGDPDLVEYAILVPQVFYQTNSARYLIRTAAGRRDEVVAVATSALAAANAERTLENILTFSQIRTNAYRSDLAMMIILCIIVVALLLVTGLGIVGLANLWVSQRRTQIGVRRALGATRGEIVLHFLTENFLITSIGFAAGSLFTYGLNLWLMRQFHEPLLPLDYVLFGYVVMTLLGQIAVMGPAVSASHVAPATAARGA